MQSRLFGIELFGHEVARGVVFFAVDGVDVVGHEFFELRNRRSVGLRLVMSVFVLNRFDIELTRCNLPGAG